MVAKREQLVHAGLLVQLWKDGDREKAHLEFSGKALGPAPIRHLCLVWSAGVESVICAVEQARGPCILGRFSVRSGVCSAVLSPDPAAPVPCLGGLGSLSLCGFFTYLPLSVLSLPQDKHLGLSSRLKDKFESFHPLSCPASEFLSLHYGHFGAENSCRWLSWHGRLYSGSTLECQQHPSPHLSPPECPQALSAVLWEQLQETSSSACTCCVLGSPGTPCEAVSERHSSGPWPAEGPRAIPLAWGLAVG